MLTKYDLVFVMNDFDVASFLSPSVFKPVKPGGSKSPFSIFIHDSN